MKKYFIILLLILAAGCGHTQKKEPPCASLEGFSIPYHTAIIEVNGRNYIMDSLGNVADIPWQPANLTTEEKRAPKLEGEGEIITPTR